MSAAARSLAARNVSRSGAPGPAPTRYTVLVVRSTSRRRRVDGRSRRGSDPLFAPRDGNRPAVQAALLVLGSLPPPAPRANVLAQLDRPRARRAADARVPEGVQCVRRHLVAPDVAPDVVLAPVGHWIELGEAVLGVELFHGQIAPRYGLRPPQPRSRSPTQERDVGRRPAGEGRSARGRVDSESGSSLIRGGRRRFRRAPAEEWHGPGPRRLIVVAEVGQAFERILEVAVGAHGEGVETALRKAVELVAQDVADGSQLAREAVLLTQEPSDRVTAAVGELREVDGDEGQGGAIRGERIGIVGRPEPDA